MLCLFQQNTASNEKIQEDITDCYRHCLEVGNFTNVEVYYLTVLTYAAENWIWFRRDTSKLQTVEISLMSKK